MKLTMALLVLALLLLTFNCREYGETCQQVAYMQSETCQAGCSGTPAQCNKECEKAWMDTYTNCMAGFECAPIIYQ